MRGYSKWWVRGRALAGIAVLATAVACQSAIEAPDPTQGVVAEVGKQFEVRVGQTATVEALRLKLVAISEDSRCAIDVVCVWQGNAKAQIDVTTGVDGPTVRIALNTGYEPMEANVSGLRVRLVGVLPAARSTVSIAPNAYSVLLVVERP